jgi:hypothetical protein
MSKIIERLHALRNTPKLSLLPTSEQVFVAQSNKCQSYLRPRPEDEMLSTNTKPHAIEEFGVHRHTFPKPISLSAPSHLLSASIQKIRNVTQILF